jgi:hypothetical protein
LLSDTDQIVTRDGRQCRRVATCVEYQLIWTSSQDEFVLRIGDSPTQRCHTILAVIDRAAGGAAIDRLMRNV